MQNFRLIPVVLAQGTGHHHGDEGGPDVGVVPEPSSLILALVSVAIVAIFFRWRTK